MDFDLRRDRDWPNLKLPADRTVDEYLESIRGSNDIEGENDSKELAQEAVLEWKDGKRTLTVPDRALLIREMLYGGSGAKDSFYIELLVDGSTDTEVKVMIDQYRVLPQLLSAALTPQSTAWTKVQDIINPNTGKDNIVGNRMASMCPPGNVSAPYGRCYESAMDRFERAYKDIMGQDVHDVTGPDFDYSQSKENPKKSEWYKLWSSQGKHDEKVAGGGGPGALVNQGWGEFVTHKQIWEEGKLKPGAVIQTWMSEDDYNAVKKGEARLGHSFIFLEYKREGDKADGKIEKVRTANQWGEDFFAEHFSYGNFWIGANITVSPPLENVPNAKTSSNVAELLSGDNQIDESGAVDANILAAKNNKLDAIKIVAKIKEKSTALVQDNIKTAIGGLNPDRFNIYFAQLVALYQLGNAVKPTGKLDDGTSKMLTGKDLKSAVELQKDL